MTSTLELQYRGHVSDNPTLSWKQVVNCRTLKMYLTDIFVSLQIWSGNITNAADHVPGMSISNIASDSDTICDTFGVSLSASEILLWGNIDIGIGYCSLRGTGIDYRRYVLASIVNTMEF